MSFIYCINELKYLNHIDYTLNKIKLLIRIDIWNSD